MRLALAFSCFTVILCTLPGASASRAHLDTFTRRFEGR